MPQLCWVNGAFVEWHRGGRTPLLQSGGVPCSSVNRRTFPVHTAAIFLNSMICGEKERIFDGKNREKSLFFPPHSYKIFLSSVFYKSCFFHLQVVQFTTTAAATAKSLQSCPTLCDPIDGSPPGSPVPGTLGI